MVVKRRRTQQRAAAQERNDAVLRQHSNPFGRGSARSGIILAKHHREWAEVAVLLQFANGVGDRGAPDSRPSARGWSDRDRSTASQRRLSSGRCSHSPGASCHARGFPRSAGSASLPLAWGSPGSVFNPLKTTASSRRASTLAARRNKASTLVISGSAICAPRSSTFTCRVAS